MKMKALFALALSGMMAFGAGSPAFASSDEPISLAGTLGFGNQLTASLKAGETMPLDGNGDWPTFDLWLCPTTDLKPRDGVLSPEECLGYYDAGLSDGEESVVFTLLPPESESEDPRDVVIDDDRVCSGTWYAIVNVYNTPNWSNWIGPTSFDCSGSAAGGPVVLGIGLNLETLEGAVATNKPVSITGHKQQALAPYKLTLEGDGKETVTLAHGLVSLGGNFSGHPTLVAVTPGTYSLVLVSTDNDDATYKLVQQFTVTEDGRIGMIGTPVGSITNG
jgi:hypothetical protein